MTRQQDPESSPQNARRGIEPGKGGYPALVAAAALSGGRDGDERERAVRASRTVIRLLAVEAR